VIGFFSGKAIDKFPIIHLQNLSSYTCRQATSSAPAFWQELATCNRQTISIDAETVKAQFLSERREGEWESEGLTSSSFALSRPTNTRLADSLENSRAMARPIPRVAPVITTRLPRSIAFPSPIMLSGAWPVTNAAQYSATQRHSRCDD
jgi:hypothetical protein